MNSSLFPSVFFLFLTLMSVSSSVYYVQFQKNHFNEVREIYASFQEELTSLRKDADFLRKNEKEFQIFRKHEWLKSNERLKAAEMIQKFAEPLSLIHLIIEPQSQHTANDGRMCKTSKIVIEIGAYLDTHVYKFINDISNNFPGLLILRKVSLAKKPFINLSNPIKQTYFVKGEIIYEWVGLEF